VPRKAVLIPAVQQIIQKYHPIRLTVRQIFYQLVSKGIIQNTKILYTALDRELTRARWNGKIPFTALEDRVRQFQGGEEFWNITPEHLFEVAKDDYELAEQIFRWCPNRYNLPLWHGQPRFIEVWLEKDALASIFLSVTEKHKVRLAPCRGYPSLFFLYEAASHLKNEVLKNREIRILYFGDYDMRGLDIQRHITETLARLGVNAIVERIGLTKEQIQQYQLPPQPSKKDDRMRRGWIESHGDVAWELDALDPAILKQLIEESIERNVDKTVLEKRRSLISAGQKRIAELVNEYFSGESESEVEPE